MIHFRKNGVRATCVQVTLDLLIPCLRVIFQGEPPLSCGEP